MGLNWRLLVLGAVVVGLAVWIFGIDLPRERRAIEEQTEAARLLPIDPAAVDTLRVAHPEHPFTIVRRDDGWWITTPIVERAETRTMDSVLDRLTSARSERTMGLDGDDDVWANYGLAEGHPGRADIVLASASGARAALAVGNPVVTGDYVYVRRGDGALEVADQLVFDLANSTHHGFRRVDLFGIHEGDVVRIELDGPGGRWAARRDTTSGLWHPDVPDAAVRYKRWVMDDLALAIGEQRVQAFLRDGLDAEGWAAYGLDDPWGAVTVTTVDGRTQSLWLGNEREREQYFARRDGLDTVFLVRPQFAGALDAGTIGLEDFNPIPRNLRNARAFRAEDARGRWAEIRPDGMDWVLIGPDGEVESTDYRQTAADNLARGLEEVQPERSLFLPSGGDPGALLSERVGRVSIRFDDETIDVHFGWRDGETEAWFYVEGDTSLYEIERSWVLRLRSFVDAIHVDDAR